MWLIKSLKFVFYFPERVNIWNTPTWTAIWKWKVTSEINFVIAVLAIVKEATDGTQTQNKKGEIKNEYVHILLQY